MSRSRHLRGGLLGFVAFFVTAASSSSGHSRSVAAPAASAETLTLAAPSVTLPPASSPQFRGAQLDGRQFPERVLALTWDDGPDRHTLELARYLSAKRVSGTFFVVQSWDAALSDMPGSGPSVYQTGYTRLPVLAELTRLRQRIGNHTLNHVRLPRAERELFLKELADNQRQIDPFLRSEARWFRAPAGAWSASSEALLSSDPYLARLIGPFRWDVDRKDWENSLTCDAELSACERWRGGLRLKPEVTAARYLSSIEQSGRGIVLLHDRVGEVGSDYAVRLARALIPELIARRYVFAAPVLRFSPLTSRLSLTTSSWLGRLSLTDLRLADVDRDGRGDLCVRDEARWHCLRAEEHPGDSAGNTPRAYFSPSSGRFASEGRVLGVPGSVGFVRSGQRRSPEAKDAAPDVDGDRRPDRCWSASDGVRCALSTRVSFAAPTLWSSLLAETLLFGDLNGDGRSDLCAPQGAVISCAFSTGTAFTAATPWLESPELTSEAWLALADINGDARADLCSYEAGQVACALAP